MNYKCVAAACSGNVYLNKRAAKQADKILP
jgi:hypothetical protein